MGNRCMGACCVYVVMNSPYQWKLLWRDALSVPFHCMHSGNWKFLLDGSASLSGTMHNFLYGLATNNAPLETAVLACLWMGQVSAVSLEGSLACMTLCVGVVMLHVVVAMTMATCSIWALPVVPSASCVVVT